MRSKRDVGFWQRPRGLHYVRQDAQQHWGSKRGRFPGAFASLWDSNGGGRPCQQRAVARGQCTGAAKQRGGGKRIAQVRFTYQIHRLNQKRRETISAVQF